MATSFNKVYTVTVKYSRDDVGAIVETDMNVEVLREQIIKAIGGVVNVSKGIHRSDIVGTVSEA